MNLKVILNVFNEIYQFFSVPIKMEVIKTDKDGKKSAETISFNIKFIDSIRFISSLLTHHVGNLYLKFITKSVVKKL